MITQFSSVYLKNPERIIPAIMFTSKTAPANQSWINTVISLSTMICTIKAVNYSTESLRHL